MPQFTLDQKKAHDPLRHMSITANAGSGKTRVLVSRYCDLVERFGTTPEKIAAITFTEKAAAELRGKIAGELERRLTSEEHRASWRVLKIARERFPSAIVSTIHGFCSRLLREFPIETGVAPNFGVTSGYERRRLLEEALMDAIESALSEDENEEFDLVYNLARKIGRENMESILRMMLDRREMIYFSRMHGVLALDRDAAVRRWIDAVERTLRTRLHGVRLESAVTDLASMMKPDAAAETLQAFADLRAARTADAMIAHALTLRTLILTEKGTVRKRLLALKGEDAAVADAPAEAAAAAFRSVAPFLETDGDPALHAELHDDTATLLAIYDNALARYNERKERLNVLDFEDLQLHLATALQAPAFRTLVHERFDHIMIDEFQDTNELQYTLARQMFNDLEDGRLCIVGDTKQSIYGFRNADVEVFSLAERQIGAANDTLGRSGTPLHFRDELIDPANDEERRGAIKLAASFRLLPSICAYVNEACSLVLRRHDGAQFGVDYEPLVSARRTEGRGTVELILAPSEGGTDAEAADAEAADAEAGGATEAEEACQAEDAECSEAEMIARRLLDLVRSAEPVVWDTDGTEAERPRGARFSDIAILCRKRSQFAAIESAFRLYGIPFATHGGSGFYRTQEIFDMLNYLRTLLNPRDDISLLGVLRSPFFGVSDAEIYRITLTSGRIGRDLWSRSVEHVAAGNAQPALARAVAIIEDDRAMAGRVPASLLLRRALERTGWRGAVIGAERGEQNLANVDKLLEMAREFELRGFTNLFDFVERITEMVEFAEMEGEAPLNTGRDAVRLMTMHAAKGLEYPVVVLPSLHAPTRASTEPFFDKDLGFGWTWRFNHQERRPAITALMGLRAAEREGAEEARLFYVAATRARDLLILSGEYNENRPPSGTMLAWAIAPLPMLPDGNGDVRLVSSALSFLEADGEGMRTEEWEQSVRVLRTVPQPPPEEEVERAEMPFRAEAVRIGEIPARAEGEIYSATQLMIYSQCPTKYYLKYRLGIPEEIADAYRVDMAHHAEGRDGIADTDDGALFARAFRSAAMNLDRAMDPETGLPLREDPGAESGALARVVADALALEPMMPAEREAMRVRLIGTLERLLASPEARSVITAPDGATAANYELTMPVGREYLMGVMDRVIRSSNGALSAVQYKTRRLKRDEVPAAAEAYLPQLRVYAYLLAALEPKRTAVTCTILFTEHPDIPQTFTFSSFEQMRIGEEIASGIEDIRALTYSGRRDLPLATPHCPACAYFVQGECVMKRAGRE
ncbi:MAG TPA: UvrD-helicase domain-containing protein [Candidatus Kapabacteria bacterium]|nr:UvrD-helicase domain-containing protein [Candidatus Kapabacteria bacterium]